MKYFEILVIKSNRNSYYEGRFFVEALDKVMAISKVRQILEITNNEFEFYFKELGCREFYFNKNLQNKNRTAKNRVLESYFVGDNSVDYSVKTNITGFESSTIKELDFVDLRAY